MQLLTDGWVCRPRMRTVFSGLRVPSPNIKDRLGKDDRKRMDVHSIDGTYELFRHSNDVPAAADVNGQEIGASRGVLLSVLSFPQELSKSLIIANFPAATFHFLKLARKLRHGCD
jgi:hypothetical protein